MLYPTVLTLHSIIRWIVVLFAVLATVAAIVAWRRRQAWAPGLRRLEMLFTTSLDIQVLLGLLLLFVLSPITTAAFQNLGASLQSPALAFFLIEHPLAMLAAVALAHIGSRRARNLSGEAGPRQAAVFNLLAVLAILAAIPWPFLAAGRPLI